ncbi:transcriptional regulator NrdR [archaeon]|nr:transcriptional regulator NrdR [archaeon]
MQCPFCQSQELKVTDTRETDEITTRRRRECLKCNKRFTTYEAIQSSNITVIKKDGKREQFNIDKIKTGILKATEKRPIPSEKIEKIINQIQAKLNSYNTTEVPVEKIGNLVMQKLKTLDKVAYIRFASVYKDFTDLDSFKQELKSLIKKR